LPRGEGECRAEGPFAAIRPPAAIFICRGEPGLMGQCLSNRNTLLALGSNFPFKRLVWEATTPGRERECRDEPSE
jgi:hypothetical protein